MSPVEALTQIRALCDESRSIVRTADVRAVLDAVSVDATPAQGPVRDALVMLIDGWGAEQPLHLADAVLALVRPVEGVVLSPEEAADIAAAASVAAVYLTEDGWAPRLRALATRLEASA